MTRNKVYKKILKAGKPQLAVLIDPDKFNAELIRVCRSQLVSYFFVGGSQLNNGKLKKTVSAIKTLSNIPVVIFPGDEKQLCPEADAVLFLSLLSGRNPEYLIGKQVKAAPLTRKKNLESISTAYLVLEGKNVSTTQKVTGTRPLINSADIRNTSIAGEMLGFKLLYLEAGSGAEASLSCSMIKKVKKAVKLPLLIGGGINSAARAQRAIAAGANIIVVGNALEKDIHLIHKLTPLFK